MIIVSDWQIEWRFYWQPYFFLTEARQNFIYYVLLKEVVATLAITISQILVLKWHLYRCNRFCRTVRASRYKNSAVLEHGDNVSLKTDDSKEKEISSTLAIENTTSDDDCDVKVVARNKAGVVEHTVKLLVIGMYDTQEWNRKKYIK